MKLSKLFQCVVVSAMKNGFRRAGVPLERGANNLELDEHQIKLFERDPAMNIEVVKELAIDVATTVAAAKLGVSTAQIADTADAIKQVIENDNTTQNLKDAVINVATNAIADSAAAALTNAMADLADGANVEGTIVEMDFAWAGEELAPCITAIHNLHVAQPLAKKPLCDQLLVNGEHPSATERDAAWQYYFDNVINHVAG